MKARMGVLLVLLCLLPGCVAIPPLVTVQHHRGSEDPSLKSRLEQLEHRVRELESKAERP